jgi:hypothetical protein
VGLSENSPNGLAETTFGVKCFLAFTPPGDALRSAITHGRALRTVPVFMVNSRWRPGPPPTGPREPPPPPERAEIRVWRFDDRSGLGTAAQACEEAGEAPGDVEAARKGWETRRQNGNGGTNSRRGTRQTAGARLVGALDVKARHSGRITGVRVPFVYHKLCFWQF